MSAPPIPCRATAALTPAERDALAGLYAEPVLDEAGGWLPCPHCETDEFLHPSTLPQWDGKDMPLVECEECRLTAPVPVWQQLPRRAPGGEL